MKKGHREEAERWWRQASADSKDGEYLLNGRKYNLACFIFQQAAEKALKAFLYSQGEDVVVGHAVHKLLQSCAGYDRDFKEISSEVNGLDGYYIPTRYPNGLPDGVPADVFTLKDAQHAREMCQKIMTLVSQKIES